MNLFLNPRILYQTLSIEYQTMVHVPVNIRYTHGKDKRAMQGDPLIKVRRS